MSDLDNIPVLGTLIRFTQWRESSIETWAIFLTLTGLQLIDVAEWNIHHGQHYLGFVNIFGSMFGAAFAMFLLRRVWLMFVIAIGIFLLAHGGIVHI